MAQIPRRPGLRYAVLTPDMHGYEAAVAAGANEVAVFASSSEGFNRANLNCSIEESLARFALIMEAAKGQGMPVRGYLSGIIARSFNGKVSNGEVTRLARRLLDMGRYEVSLGDTIGAGDAASMDALLRDLVPEVPAMRLAGQFHDTHGTSLGMVDFALNQGLRVFDALIAGLGGCPNVSAAPGNLATEALHAHVGAAGATTGVDTAALAVAALVRLIPAAL